MNGPAQAGCALSVESHLHRPLTCRPGPSELAVQTQWVAVFVPEKGGALMLSWSHKSRVDASNSRGYFLRYMRALDDSLSGLPNSSSITVMTRLDALPSQALKNLAVNVAYRS